MGIQTPKARRDHLKYKDSSYGIERRRNLTKIILEKGAPIPKPIEYSDIDRAVYQWVKSLDITLDGNKFPTYRLFATQRIGEYMQTWKELDANGNPVLNFKTVTRDSNPQQGEQQGKNANIPGFKRFAMFYVPVELETGVEAYDKYTVEQPFAVDFLYKMSVVTSKYEVLNEINQKIQREFSATQCYVAPNGYYMPMTLTTISDESEYAVDDWKYYSQTFDIKLLGFVIPREAFHVERIPSRLVIGLEGVRMMEKIKPHNRTPHIDFVDWSNGSELASNVCALPMQKKDSSLVKPKGKDKDFEGFCEVEEVNYDRHKIIRLHLDFGECITETEFEMDRSFVLDAIDLENIRDLQFFVNDELIHLDEVDVTLIETDIVRLKIMREDLYKGSKITLEGHSVETVNIFRDQPESSLDEEPPVPPMEEDLNIELEQVDDEKEIYYAEGHR